MEVDDAEQDQPAQLCENRRLSRLERELQSSLPSGPKDAVPSNIGLTAPSTSTTAVATTATEVLMVSADIETEILDALW